MSRRGSNKSGQDSSVFRAAGVVRVPGDSTPLKVLLSISATHVLMTADGAELGSWALPDVRITRIDPFSFAFVAEGDRVVFVPDDVKGFAAHDVVSVDGSGAKTGPRLKLKDRFAVKRTRSGERSPSRTDAGIPPPTPARSSSDTQGGRANSSEKSKPPRRMKRAKESADDAARTGMWLKAIDSARENGWFGLDRVPVHLDQRDKEHQHTYDHGAAATTGLGKRVCTVCGKLRLRS